MLFPLLKIKAEQKGQCCIIKECSQLYRHTKTVSLKTQLKDHDWVRRAKLAAQE